MTVLNDLIWQFAALHYVHTWAVWGKINPHPHLSRKKFLPSLPAQMSVHSWWMCITDNAWMSMLLYYYLMSACNVMANLAIHLSVECRYCVIFWHFGRGIILVFRALTPLQNSKGNPSVGALNTGGGKFLQISPFILEMVQDRPVVTMEQ